jgi:ribosomal protein S18 acetylase RimI-like enzyme
MPPVVLRVLVPDDWELWRELRLHALAEAPHAFSSTLAEWTGSGDTEERWRNRLSSVTLNLVASLNEKSVGMASATSPVDDEIELISIWVAPEARGLGIGAALIEAIVAWAREQRVFRVALDVGEHNMSAILLYKRLGFADVGLAPNSEGDAPERRMLRLLP